MKSTLIDWARKWGIGVCLLLWCWLAYWVMIMPLMLLLLLACFEVPIALLKIVGGVYAVICIPFLAYQFGREFGLRYDQIPGKERADKTAKRA